MERGDDTSQILASFVAGNITAEECFCLILSLEGYEVTRSQFLRKIDIFKLTKPDKHEALLNVYVTYFQQAPSTDFADPLGASVENGYLTSDFGYELDMELAMSCSLQEQSATKCTMQKGNVLAVSGTVEKSFQPVMSYSCAVQDRVSSQGRIGNSPSSKQDSDAFHIKNNFDSQSKMPSRSSTCAPMNTRAKLPPGLHVEQSLPSKNKKKKKSSKSANINNIQRPLSSNITIYWMRRDIRLYDNPALHAAATEGGPVIFTFLWSEKEEDPNNMLAVGGATKLWLHHALKAMNDELVDKYGHGIIFRRTNNTIEEMKNLVSETGAKSVVMNNVYEPFLSCRDDKLSKILESRGVSCKRFHSYLLHEPSSITTESIGMRGIGSVTHFMECCRQSATQPIGHPVDVPGHIPRTGVVPNSHSLEELQLARMPRRKDGTIVRTSCVLF